MSATVVTLDERNQVTLPKDARRALGVQPGGRLLVVVENQRVYLLPEVENWIDALTQRLRQTGVVGLDTVVFI